MSTTTTTTTTTITINGTETQVPAGAIGWKYADPTEDGRWVYDEQDLLEIRREDPSLIVAVPTGARHVIRWADRSDAVYFGADALDEMAERYDFSAAAAAAGEVALRDPLGAIVGWVMHDSAA